MFAPDGTFVATGGWDNTTCVWRIVDQPEVAGKGNALSRNASFATIMKSPSLRAIAGISPEQSAASKLSLRVRQKSVEKSKLSCDSSLSSEELSAVNGTPFAGAEKPYNVTTMAKPLMARRDLLSPNLGGSRFNLKEDSEQAAFNEDRRLLRHIHMNSVLSVRVCPQSKLIASTSADHSLAVYCITLEGAPTHATEMWTGHHGSYVQDCDFSNNSKMLASVGGDRICRCMKVTFRGVLIFATLTKVRPRRLWDSESGQILRVLKTSGALTRVKFSENDAMIAAGGMRGALGVWWVCDGSEISGRPHAAMCDQMCNMTSLTWTPDSRVLIASGTDGTVWAWDCYAGVLAGAFQSLSISSYAAAPIEEADQDLMGERFELPGICSAVYSFEKHASTTIPGSPMPKLKEHLGCQGPPPATATRREGLVKRQPSFVPATQVAKNRHENTPNAQDLHEPALRRYNHIFLPN